MNLQKTKVAQSSLYGVMRFWQRLTLLATMLMTVIYWVVVLFVSMNIPFAQQAGIKYQNPELLNSTIQVAINRLSYDVLGCAIGAAVVTLLFLVFKRVRTSEKRLIIDSIAVLVFCLGATAFAQLLIRNFVAHLS